MSINCFPVRNTKDDVIRPRPWSRDLFGKNLKARQRFNFCVFFSLIKFIHLKSHFTMHRFCLILKRLNFKSASKYWKIRYFFKEA